MNVWIENSTWNNIGDAFYQWPLKRLFEELVGRENVASGEGPISRGFRATGASAAKAFTLLGHQQSDLHVFSGPILKHFDEVYREAVERLSLRGERYALVSVSSAEASAEQLDAARRLLQEFPPVAFSTRDPQTYENFKDHVPSAYNGICCAFLAADLQIPKNDLEEPYITSSFYRGPEPSISIDSREPLRVSFEARRPLLGLKWRYGRHLEHRRSVPEEVGGFKIIRTHQSISYRFHHLNFNYPSTFLSYNPISYFSLYAGSSLTVSDRVHACVATLAMGRPAALLYSGERCGLFDRFQLEHSGGQIMRLEKDRIASEKANMKSYLQDALKSMAC